MYLKCDLQNFDLKDLKSKFDVILVEPPLEEYQRTMGVTNMEFWGWDQVCENAACYYNPCYRNSTYVLLGCLNNALYAGSDLEVIIVNSTVAT